MQPASDIFLGWTTATNVLVRSFVEQGINPNLGNVTGLEKIRLHPLGYEDESFAVFMPAQGVQTILNRQIELHKRFPKLQTNLVSELPTMFRFGTPCLRSYAKSCTRWSKGCRWMKSNIVSGSKCRSGDSKSEIYTTLARRVFSKPRGDPMNLSLLKAPAPIKPDPSNDFGHPADLPTVGGTRDGAHGR
jgi:hypothetical protein